MGLWVLGEGLEEWMRASYETDTSCSTGTRYRRLEEHWTLEGAEGRLRLPTVRNAVDEIDLRSKRH